MTAMPDAINANGEYVFPAIDPGREAVLEWTVTTGSATVVPGYQDLAGAFRPFTDTAGTAVVSAASGGSLLCNAPRSGVLALKVTSASSVSVSAAVTLSNSNR